MFDIDRRVDVSMFNYRTAMRASPFAVGQLKLRINLSAEAACLARRIPLIDFEELFALPCELVCEHRGEHAPAVVTDRFAEAELPALFSFRHILDADILDGDDIVLTYKMVCLLMQEVGSLISDLFMQNSYLVLLLLEVLALIERSMECGSSECVTLLYIRFELAAEPSLLTRQLLLCFFEEFWILSTIAFRI